QADALETQAGLQTASRQGVFASHVSRYASRPGHGALLAPSSADARRRWRRFAGVRDRGMPLHEYECDACGHRFEVIQKFSDPPIEKCPKCGAKVRKLISSPAFHLKGSGWYVTDYARKDTGGSAKTEDAGSKEGGEKDEGSK